MKKTLLIALVAFGAVMFFAQAASARPRPIIIVNPPPVDPGGPIQSPQ